MYLVERKGGGRHADQHVQEVAHELALSVNGRREERGGHAAADHPHFACPQAVELVEGLSAALAQVQGLSPAGRPIATKTGSMDCVPSVKKKKKKLSCTHAQFSWLDV